MDKIKPSDDAVIIAAATLATKLIDLRKDELVAKDFTAQEKHLMAAFKRVVTELIHERNA